MKMSSSCSPTLRTRTARNDQTKFWSNCQIRHCRSNRTQTCCNIISNLSLQMSETYLMFTSKPPFCTWMFFTWVTHQTLQWAFSIFMVGQSIPYLSCDGHVAWGNVLWGRNEGQHILEGISKKIVPQRPEKTVSPTLCIHFTWQWVSFSSWMIPG